MRGYRSIIFVILLVGCVEPFYPDLKSDEMNALVVDGHINLDGSASVKLSRSIPMTSNGFTPSEKDATVTIRSSSGESFSLREEDPGKYTSSGLPVSADDRFTLHIRTSQGSEYESDEVQMYPTPPIDSIYFSVAPSDDNLWIRVNTQDDNPKSLGYFLWDCIETYQYHAPMYSPFKLVNFKAVDRLPEEDVFTCWNDLSVPAVVQSTRRLSQRIISGQVVASIPRFSQKLSVRYSILVRQRAISEEEYIFRQQLISSTEQQGSIFSVVPGPVFSNVHSLANPNEYVLGYFRAQDVKERRYFITYSELPARFQAQRTVMGCKPEMTCPFGVQPPRPNICVDLINLGNKPIISISYNGDGSELGYNWVNPECGDCRSSGGGTTKRPSFW